MEFIFELFAEMLSKTEELAETLTGAQEPDLHANDEQEMTMLPLPDANIFNFVNFH